jgi:hypothetical protein
MAVFEGAVREVYQIDSWHPAATTTYAAALQENLQAVIMSPYEKRYAGPSSGDPERQFATSRSPGSSRRGGPSGRQPVGRLIRPPSLTGGELATPSLAYRGGAVPFPAACLSGKAQNAPSEKPDERTPKTLLKRAR